ncbi:MAG TPA: hypothetical protein VN577_01700 [Terriglobales bacterium]|nr:hypothetical protein [Terriglobales bacterium]
MRQLIPFETYLVVAVNIVLFAVLTWIIRRHDHGRDFPAFTAFIEFSLALEIVLLLIALSSSPRVYFYTYWSGQLVTFAFLFCVVHEVFDSVTERARWLPRSIKRALIRMATAVSAVMVAASLQIPSGARFPIMDFIVGMQRGLGMAIFGFMALTIMFSRSYSVPWHERDTGIAVGIAAALGFQTFWPKVSAFLFDSPEQKFYMKLLPIFYTVALLIWIRSFWNATRHGEGIEEAGPGKMRIIAGRKGLKRLGSP